MTVNKNVIAFWSAFISVLLKCVAALGFATPARTTRVQATVPAATPVPATAAALTGGRTPLRTAACGALLPAQRPGDRSLPPTMKQRIRAEAHGSSPSARSVARERTDATAPHSASPALADHALSTASDDAVPAARRRREAALVR